MVIWCVREERRGGLQLNYNYTIYIHNIHTQYTYTIYNSKLTQETKDRSAS